MMTGPLCRAARALTEISRDRLAEASGVDALSIQNFERKLGTLGEGEANRLLHALEAFGAAFIPANGGGIGVRLKFNESETRRIARLEGEGGIVASDDVP